MWFYLMETHLVDDSSENSNHQTVTYLFQLTLSLRLKILGKKFNQLLINIATDKESQTVEHMRLIGGSTLLTLHFLNIS